MPSPTNLRQDPEHSGIRCVLCSLCHSQSPLHSNNITFASQPRGKLGSLKENNFTKSKSQSYQTSRRKSVKFKHIITLSLFGSFSLWCSTHKWQTLAISSYGCINNRELSRKVNMYVLCERVKKKITWLHSF